ncbi:terminase small subunit [Caulobacter phage BL94]|nr:terminase small subunit [Caulobacter phage BL94]
MGSRSFPFNQHIANIVLERIAEGGKRSALSHVLADDEDLPSAPTWFKWLDERPELAKAYAHACAARAEVKAAELEEISDTPVLGEKTTLKADGSVEIVTGDMLEHRKLQVETRKWIAAKLNPSKFNMQNMAVHHSGSIAMTSVATEELVAELLAMAASGRLKLPDGMQIIEVDDPEEEPEDDGFRDLV